LAGSRVIKYNITINIPDRLDKLIIKPVLLYRRLRYGYTFRRIPLTQGKYAIVDPDDYKRLNKHKWHVYRGRKTFYAARSYRKKDGRKSILPMHRQILKVPDGLLVDHINQNGLDNRKANLRPATAAQNIINRAKYKNRNYGSKYKGVIWHRRYKCWQAQIKTNCKLIYLGSFKDEVEAAKAYDEAAKKYHGEFASLNFATKTSAFTILLRRWATQDRATAGQAPTLRN